MLELLSSGLLGSLFGGVFRLLPEVIKFFDRKNEREHELSMFKLQTDLEVTRGEYKLENRYVDHSVAQLEAINSAFQQQGQADSKAWKWVASLSALVRPGVTFIIFGMYVVFKITTMIYGIQTGAIWTELIQNSWTTDDFGILNMILTFYFVGRTIEKRTK